MNPKLKDHRHIHTEDCFAVTVRLLEDDTISEVDVPEDATGKWLFEEVCRRQDVMEEREYFGLRYLEHDLLSSPTKQWIDLTRGLFVQLKNTHPRTVSFRIKHYPADPFADLKLAKTHYLLYRQLRRDLASGRLVSGVDEMVRLAALIVQDPRRAMLSVYSTSVGECPVSTSTPLALESGGESSIIVSVTKLKKKALPDSTWCGELRRELLVKLHKSAGVGVQYLKEGQEFIGGTFASQTLTGA
ncbi:hypothetical protein T265_03930 [Opisthorchis viverrini]|uniref:FERM domain-containing protein n=1 Tax=Opisthorchis viverrini TaxID=6198 RepID=A0A075AH87_OPIVI|nr:hypothetical protein T265_03930 [Opisthorchis viverrini]KER29464.1 hypothetical protein T265_03930 [Opisthorchis viverrini]